MFLLQVIKLGSDGKVEAYGPPSEVLRECSVDSPTLVGHSSSSSSGNGGAQQTAAAEEEEEEVVSDLPTTTTTVGGGKKRTEAEEKADAAGRSLTAAEDRASGTVAKHIYLTYFSYAVAGRGGLVMFSIIAAYSAGQAARVGVDVWLSAWATASEAAAEGGQEHVESFWWVAVAAMLVLVNFLVAFGRALLCVSLSIRASTALHKRAVEAVLRAPLLYFQQNPLGR
eukprot:COSAG06_NODE_1523_length_9173_cov_31.694682_7_plen_226_part_00